MNSVHLIGRLTRDPELRFTTSQLAVATFSMAIDRPTKAGKDKETDFPRITVFGRAAENCERYLSKGKMVAVQGRLQTGSYTNKDGITVYTTDVISERVEFIDWNNDSKAHQEPATRNEKQTNIDDIPDSFQAIDEDVPF